MMSPVEKERRFPVLRGSHDPQGPRDISWSLLEPHRKQAELNHGQTLERLAQRGGLCPQEIVAVLENRSLKDVVDMSYHEAISVIATRSAEELGYWP